ncbi:hypothetical protein GCM10020001_106590 [Nonomuraea salmonea]
MGWDVLALVDDEAADDRPLIERRAVVRGGFYEMQARTVIERVPPAAGIVQEWAISPPIAGVLMRAGGAVRGRGIGGWGWVRGADFDERIVVRPNVVERLRAELARWDGQELAVGGGW